MEQLIQKRREFNLPTYILFIDYEKAFDRMPRGMLWNIMNNKGFPDHIVKTVQSLYINDDDQWCYSPDQALASLYGFHVFYSRCGVIRSTIDLF
jgi:hypothetical protein